MDSSSLRRCKTLKSCSGRTSLDKDWISGMPDEILVYILSFLTLKEAVSTSIISKRWIHVWAYVPVLILNADKRLDETVCKHDLISLKAEIEKYLCFVDQVVSSYKAPTVDEFTLRAYLGEDRSDAINKFVKFAAEKQVKRLELAFGSSAGSSPRPYSFPSIPLFNSLTSLKLAVVSVVGEVLESIIYICKALEVLSVTQSHVLGDLKVVGPSLKLKFLRIHYCFKLKNLEISAPNLVSVDYYGQDLGMPFKSTPKLTELSIGGGIVKPDLIMSFINHQIEVLKQKITNIKLFSKVFPQCVSVKMLDVMYTPQNDQDLFLVRSLINACPLLHKLVIQLDLGDRKKAKIESEEAWCHNHLKIVEIIGFAVSALPFVRYLVKNVVSLEKITIDPLPPFAFRFPEQESTKEDKKIIRARKQAEKLGATLKPGTELEIR